MTFPELVAAWKENAEGELVHTELRPARHGIHSVIDPPIHPLVSARLAERGVVDLYRHQTAAIGLIRRGVSTAVVAGTASGKTLCYQVPISEAILSGDGSTALLVYPTKALAQDQLRSFTTLAISDIAAATYDGDTPTDERSRIRRRSNVILTNPDMLHVGILPFHDSWEGFFSRLAFVVIDEMHTFRGIFGSHVAMILRRLRRIARHYGSSPVFVFSSATIGNPGQLAALLCGMPVEVVDTDDSPAGEQTVALWNPPVTDEVSNRRRSTLSEATDRFCDLVDAGLNTIAFVRSRKATELMYRWAAERLGSNRVAAYRAGYLPEQRRQVEARLFSGRLAGVIATNALELGIDVGGLDAAVLTGFPGTISAFRQQAGRAGRRLDASAVVLVAGEDALDQYFMSHPRELFGRPAEAAVINPDNPGIVEAHSACAAHELPLELADREILGEGLEEAANDLVQAGHLHQKDDRLFWSGRRRPAAQIDIRSAGGPTLTITVAGRPLGTVDLARALRDAHPGAVYLHQGATYVVEQVDVGRREIVVREADVDYYTQPREEKHLEIVEAMAARSIGPVERSYGKVRVESHVVAYQMRRLGSREVIDTIPLELPPTTLETEGIWFAIPEEVLTDARIDHRQAPGALHAAEHAAIAMLPLLAICDRWDLGGISTPWHFQLGRPAIFIYEAYAGGSGISPVAFEAGARHLEATFEAIRSCPCAAGCPSCIQSPKCGNFNEPLSKDGAGRLLQTLLNRSGAETAEVLGAG